MEKPLTILRTAVGCPASISFIKELKKRKVRVIGTDCNPLSVGFYVCDKWYVVPRGDDPNFIKKILEICKKEKVNAIISGPEEELISLSRNKELFEKIGVLVLSPDFKSVDICADKLKTHRFFEKNNIPTPKIYGKDDVKFPAIIKPRFGRGGKEVYRVDSLSELEPIIEKVTDPIIQEYVSGTEYTIDTFADLDGNPLSIVPRIRIQVESGISVKGITKFDKELIEYSKKIVKELKLVGPACIQVIKNDNLGPKFIEINPRFGGGSILSIKADPTIIDNLLKIIRGEKPIPSKGFKENLMMLRYYAEVFIGEENAHRNNL